MVAATLETPPAKRLLVDPSHDLLIANCRVHTALNHNTGSLSLYLNFFAADGQRREELGYVHIHGLESAAAATKLLGTLAPARREKQLSASAVHQLIDTASEENLVLRSNFGGLAADIAEEYQHRLVTTLASMQAEPQVICKLACADGPLLLSLQALLPDVVPRAEDILERLSEDYSQELSGSLKSATFLDFRVLDEDTSGRSLLTGQKVCAFITTDKLVLVTDGPCTVIQDCLAKIDPKVPGTTPLNAMARVLRTVTDHNEDKVNWLEVLLDSWDKGLKAPETEKLKQLTNDLPKLYKACLYAARKLESLERNLNLINGNLPEGDDQKSMTRSAEVVHGLLRKAENLVARVDHIEDRTATIATTRSTLIQGKLATFGAVILPLITSFEIMQAFPELTLLHRFGVVACSLLSSAVLTGVARWRKWW